MPCLKLHITGPEDTAAEHRLVHALQTERGVFGVVMCHDTRGVEIDFEDDEVTIDRLVAIAREEGFQAKVGG
jgi:hypothetical protein